MVNSVKEVKEALRKALEKLENIDENKACYIIIDNGEGLYYEEDINHFEIKERGDSIYIEQKD